MAVAIACGANDGTRKRNAGQLHGAGDCCLSTSQHVSDRCREVQQRDAC